jgi:hypothetical protein
MVVLSTFGREKKLNLEIIGIANKEFQVILNPLPVLAGIL